MEASDCRDRDSALGDDAGMARMDAIGGRRLVVGGEDGATVQGLLCLNTRRDGFCG